MALTSDEPPAAALACWPDSLRSGCARPPRRSGCRAPVSRRSPDRWPPLYSPIGNAPPCRSGPSPLTPVRKPCEVPHCVDRTDRPGPVRFNRHRASSSSSPDRALADPIRKSTGWPTPATKPAIETALCRLQPDNNPGWLDSKIVVLNGLDHEASKARYLEWPAGRRGGARSSTDLGSRCSGEILGWKPTDFGALVRACGAAGYTDPAGTALVFTKGSRRPQVPSCY